MAAIQLQATLPSLPSGWSAEKDFKAVSTLSQPTSRAIEAVGPHFLAHARRKRHKRTFSEDERIQAASSAKKTEDEDDGEISEPEDPMLLQREAKDWKTQDHYAVLGLSKKRWRASEEEIKKAHRKKVLKHHPDKKAASGQEENDQFFKCIQRATDILLDPIKRRQFDSVDENADKEPPSKKEVQKKPGNFYKLFGPVFESEGRFSKVQPVPQLGGPDASREHVEEFYNFWYNFDSWRSFEYLDEDVPDDNENRDQKRHQERKNLNARKKRKVEDTQRLRKLLDDTMAQDERIKKFRQEGNKEKNKKRLEKEAAEKAAKEEAQRKKEEEERLQKEKDASDKAAKEESKKAKEAAKNAAKKNKRVIRNAAKDGNYFADGEPSPQQIDQALNDTDALITKLEVDEIATMTNNLAGKKGADVKNVFVQENKRLVEAGKAKEEDDLPSLPGRLEACARDLLAAGASLALTYGTNKAALDTLLDELKPQAGDRKITAHQCDVAREEDLDRLFDEIKQAHSQHPDILVVNAGYGKRTSNILDISLDEWDYTINVNLRSSFILTKLAIPHMQSRHWGRVIYISSIAAGGTSINGCHYSASKAGLQGLSKNLANKLGKDGITFNDVAPAMITDTGMIPSEENLKGTPGDVGNIPVGRSGKPEECAGVVTMLCRTGYMTGQSILLSGGLK
ncbi:DnaJ-domain-containing protein [Hortaea werneckii]|nr:DnaJ-domain-containing protein [Hortaea werneckii]